MKYRKKPVVIEAEQFWPDKKPWPVGVSKLTNPNRPFYIVETIHGPVEIEPGCWVIPEDEPGKGYPVTPDIFEKTYEAVE